MPYHLLRSRLGSQQPHLGPSLFMEAVAKAGPGSSEGGIAPSCRRGLAARFWKARATCDQKYGCGHFWKMQCATEPKGRETRSCLFPGEEMKKLGQVQIPSVHSYNKYLSSTYYVPSSVLGAAGIQGQKSQFLRRLHGSEDWQ